MEYKIEGGKTAKKRIAKGGESLVVPVSPDRGKDGRMRRRKRTISHGAVTYTILTELLTTLLGQVTVAEVL